jgi:hypothetical protein
MMFIVSMRINAHDAYDWDCWRVVSLYLLRQESQRVVIYDPFRRHLQFVLQSSSTRSAVILGG